MQYNLCNEPRIKYSMAAVADRGLKPSQWTSARTANRGARAGDAPHALRAQPQRAAARRARGAACAPCWPAHAWSSNVYPNVHPHMQRRYIWMYPMSASAQMRRRPTRPRTCL